MNGALLEDGTIIRLPPPEAERLAAELAPGAPLCVQGDGVAGPLGRVIEARSIGPNSTKLAEVAVPAPPGPGWRSAPPPPPGGPAMAPRRSRRAAAPGADLMRAEKIDAS